MTLTKRLRVGIVLDDTLDRPDGVQQYVMLVGRWLSEQGHAVYYLVGKTHRDDVINVHSLSRTVRVAFNANTLSIPLPASGKRVTQLLDELKLDVLHVQMPYSPLMAGRVVARRTHEALVGTFHILPYGRVARAGTSVLGSVQRRNLNRFDAVMGTSPASSEFARTTYGLGGAVVVPNPVDLAHFQQGSAKGGRRTTIVFLGRLVERKGALQLIKAFQRMQADGVTNVELRIGGKGPLAKKLKQYVAAYKLQDSVYFDGFVAEDTKPSYLASADIAVFPAMSGESFGIVLTEAMAAGAGVVLGGDNPGYRSVLGDWPECLLQADDTQAFADRLKTFVQDTDLRKRIHAQQQQAVNQYDIEVVGARVVELYRQAILHRAKKDATIEA